MSSGSYYDPENTGDNWSQLYTHGGQHNTGYGAAEDHRAELGGFAEQPEGRHELRSPLTETGMLARPYARTRGRTRPDYDLPIEALVRTSDHAAGDREAIGLAEHRSISRLCIETRSVAEVAARMRLPLGVVRVLIGDMATMGLVQVHQNGLVSGDQPSIAFLERVLSGLRRL
ncbi:hypothetical protein GCM10022247_29500 [Allokutzneria multivorans]|uniref:DUF742 domain-containing protein n=1 Tax=Allokutzneria multivorans TaxID=1142134 RepID=A0ABP7S2U1_9PSEU